MKQCSKCLEVKPLAEFHKRVASVDRLAYKCKLCVNSYSENWKKENPNAHADWYSKHKAHKAKYFKNWRKKNKNTEPLRMLDWSRKNQAKVNSKNAKRNADRLQAVPPWVDLASVREIYRRCAELRKSSGLKYEVDHIVPLRGKTVCGLHHAGNLQIILEFDNISKLNRTWPGMVIE